MSNLKLLLQQMNTSDLEFVTIIEINIAMPKNSAQSLEAGLSVFEFFEFSEFGIQLSEIKKLYPNKIEIGETHRPKLEYGNTARIRVTDSIPTFNISTSSTSYTRALILEFTDAAIIKKIENIKKAHLTKKRLDGSK